MKSSSLKTRFTDNRLLVLNSFLVITLLIFFFMPAVIFNANGDFLNGQYIGSLLYSLLATILTLGIIGIIILALPEKTSRYLAPLSAYLALSFFIMGFYLTPLVIDIGLIDGTENSLVLQSSYRVMEVIISVVLLICFYRYYTKIRKVLQDILFVAVILVLGFSAYIGFIDFRRSTQTDLITTDREDFFVLSENENVLVFLFDTLSSDFLMALLNEDPELANKLDGFTLFRDAMSVSPTTYLAMPTIHSGQYLDPGQSIMTSYEEHVGSQSFLTKTVNNGAKAIVLNTMITCPSQVSCTNSADILLNGGTKTFLDWSLLVDISLFRLLPYSIKTSVYNDGEWFFYRKLQQRNPLQIDSYRDNQLLSDFAAGITVQGEQAQVKFIHLFNTHYPFNMNTDCEVIEANNFDINLALNSARCGVYRFLELIEKLKELGVYDSTVIAVIADHGAHMGIATSSNMDKIEINTESLFRIDMPLAPSQRENLPNNINNAKPIFMVKRPDTRGELVLDTQHAVSLTDFSTTLCTYTQLCSVDIEDSYNAFEAPAANERLRQYNDYTWQTAFWGASNLDAYVEKKQIDFSLISDDAQASLNSETFEFNQQGINFEGFGFVESWGRWNDGYSASVDICLANADLQNTDLIFEVRAFLTETSPLQHVNVLVNGGLVTEELYDLSNYTGTYHDLRVPLAQATVDREGCIVLTFEMPDATIPNIETPEDKRLMAIGFKSLRIEDVAL